MKTGQSRIRRVAADLGSVRAETPRHTGTDYRRAGVVSDIAVEDAAALSFLSQILVGDETWSVGEVRRLLDLRERGQAGLAG